jgi:hypothetical protein
VTAGHHDGGGGGQTCIITMTIVRGRFLCVRRAAGDKRWNGPCCRFVYDVLNDVVVADDVVDDGGKLVAAAAAEMVTSPSARPSPPRPVPAAVGHPPGLGP